MARESEIILRYGTRAALNAVAAANGLIKGEPFLIDDEARIGVALTVSTYETFAKQSEAGGGSSPGIHAFEPGITTGSYISQVINASALVTIAAAANRLDFFPFIPEKNVTLNELALEVTTLIAGSQARVGIYSATVAGLPDALLTGAGTLLDCATTGAKASAIAGNITLTAGTIYWLAVHSSSTQTYRGVALAALLSLGHAATGTAIYSCRRATATFATGLPATAPATTLTSAILPWLRMRLA